MRIIAFGAHPDDCEIGLGGVAMRFVELGHAVKFVSVASGDAGHFREGGGALALRRRAEAAEAGRRLGIAEYQTLDFHDGEIVPSLELRNEMVRQIRRWQPDLVFCHRPNDYHPDHRYVGTAVQDAAYLVMVPNLCPDTPPLRYNPVFLFTQDPFTRPCPFRPDIAVAIDDLWERKVEALDAHVSQFYEWLPWVDHILDQVPADPDERKRWLSHWLEEHLDLKTPAAAVREALQRYYGPRTAEGIRHAEAFEVCEYGRRPDDAEIRRLFPFLP